jgi:hydroxymethylbilane synthase
VIAQLQELSPETTFVFQAVKTSGDDPTSRPYGSSGVKGLFVKEIESALLSGQIDLAVHSAKDMTSLLPDGLVVSPAGERDDPGDVLVSGPNLPLDQLPAGTVVGTSSLRRSAFLQLCRPDLVILPVRGNIETRIKKIGRECSAVILAKAALNRLDVQSFLPADAGVFDIPLDVMAPAPGQGQLALERRDDDSFAESLAARLERLPAALALAAERAFMSRLGLGCTAPVAAHCSLAEPDRLFMRAFLFEAGSREPKHVALSRRGDSAAEAAELGRLVASKLQE